MRLRESVTPYMLLFPALFILFFLMITPMVITFYISLHNVTISNIARYWPFIGLRNYISVLHSSQFWDSLRVSVKFVIASILGQFIIGFSLAYLLTKEHKLGKFLRPIFILPWFMSMIVVGYSWLLMFHTRFGFINNYLLFHHYIPWLDDPHLAIWSIAIANIWWGTAFTMLNMETALTSVSPEILDAAEVDGATGIEKLRFIVIPLIKPFIAMNLILITMWTVNLFGLMLVMTGGGPIDSTRVVALYMYQEAFSYGDIARGSAIGIILLIINLTLAYIYLKVSR